MLAQAYTLVYFLKAQKALQGEELGESLDPKSKCHLEMWIISRTKDGWMPERTKKEEYTRFKKGKEL